MQHENKLQKTHIVNKFICPIWIQSVNNLPIISLIRQILDIIKYTDFLCGEAIIRRCTDSR